MEWDLRTIAEKVGGMLKGDGKRMVRGIASPGSAENDKLVVAWERKVFSVVPEGVPVAAPKGWIEEGRDGIELEDPRSVFPSLLGLFEPRRSYPKGIHGMASVSPEASVDPESWIGPFCVVEAGAAIGRGAVLKAQVFVGKDAVIGDGTVLEPMVSIMDGTRVGRNCLVHAGAVLGCDGFGFNRGPEGETIKVPQIGCVVVEDEVEIGACTTIDRATVGETRIGARTKTDNHDHVGHNARTGSDCLLVAYTGIAGSSKLGSRVTMAARSGTADHVRVGDGAVVAGCGGATKDVEPGAVVSGFPARDHREEMKIQALLRRLPEWAEKVRNLENRLKALEGKMDPADG